MGNSSSIKISYSSKYLTTGQDILGFNFYPMKVLVREAWLFFKYGLHSIVPAFTTTVMLMA